MVFFFNLGVYRPDRLGCVPPTASPQSLDFLNFGQKSSFLNWETVEKPYTANFSAYNHLILLHANLTKSKKLHFFDSLWKRHKVPIHNKTMNGWALIYIIHFNNFIFRPSAYRISGV